MNTTDIDWSKFGPILRSRRVEFSLSQADLARELGISQPSVSFTERGSPVGLTEERLALLLQILRIPNSDVPTLAPVQVQPNKTHVFLSYSHRDGDVLNRLLVHLRPLAKKGLIDDWNVRTASMPGARLIERNGCLFDRPWRGRSPSSRMWCNTTSIASWIA